MAILVRAQSSIQGLPATLSALTAGQGVLANLTTTAKTSLVEALNEVKASAVTGALLSANNLDDLGNLVTARTNLEVMSSTEVSDAITAAKLALGTNFTVADLTARDALTDLDVSDRVMVLDDGDAKWALYKPATIDGGVVTAWTKLHDQDALENAISGPALKAAYEANADTNAFTDAEKAKLAIALDDNDLVTAITGASTDAEVPTAAAVATLVEANATLPLLETLVVTLGDITLTQTPKGGLSGVMNFATVRYINAGVAYDAPLIATGDPKVFTVSTDSAGEWDGNSVQVQYVYAPTV